MAKEDKQARLYEILMEGIFGIWEDMPEEDKVQYREFLKFHLKDIDKDFEKVLLTLDRDRRMLLEKIFIEHKDDSIIKDDFNINDTQLKNGIDEVFRVLRNPKRAKYLLRYVEDGWKNYIDKDFDGV